MLPNSYDLPFSTSKTMKWMLSYTHLHDLVWCPLNRGVHLVNVYLLRIRQGTSELYSAICPLYVECLLNRSQVTYHQSKVSSKSGKQWQWLLFVISAFFCHSRQAILSPHSFKFENIK